MDFKIKRNGKFDDVLVTIDNTKIELGLFDEKERKGLARDLLETVHNLVWKDFSTQDEYDNFVAENS